MRQPPECCRKTHLNRKIILGKVEFYRKFIFILLTNSKKASILETKKGYFVSNMKDKIIRASIEGLKNDGLKFSVDALANKLKISKKTVYKYFPDKETLSIALYETYYSDAAKQARELIRKNTADSYKELLYIYFDSKKMTRNDIFNKYKLNQTIDAYTKEKSDSLWEMTAASFSGKLSETDKRAFRIIVDGSFEKLCEDGDALNDVNDVIERLANMLW